MLRAKGCPGIVSNAVHWQCNEGEGFFKVDRPHHIKVELEVYFYALALNPCPPWGEKCAEH